MPRLQLYNRRKGHTYKQMDNYVRQQLLQGGTEFLVHKYVGPVSSDDPENAVPINLSGDDIISELTIQDIFFQENRDRIYNNDVYSQWGHYTISDNDFDLSQFGLFLPNDVKFVEFHLNDMVDTIGRKFMSGDVLEIPHLRDELLLDATRPAINKFFVITDVNKASDGYSPLWYTHLYRVKIEPMPVSQEYNDILDREIEDSAGETLRDILSTFNDDIAISDAIAEEADRRVPQYNFETAHFYYVPDNDTGVAFPWIFAGDGEPPNGAELLGSGNGFPNDAVEGEWFLRTDYTPAVLFQREGNCWRRREVDYRRKWTAAHRILTTFINNDNITTMPNGEEFAEKTAISKAVKPRVDL